MAASPATAAPRPPPPPTQDTGNNAIRVVNFTSGVVNTIVGNTSAGTQDTIAPYVGMPAVDATAGVTFDGPTGLASIGQVLFVCDTNNNRIRAVVADAASGFPVGTTLAVAGGGTSLVEAGSALNNGAGSNALFSAPTGLAWYPTGNPAQWTLFIADTGNNAIRQVTVTALDSTHLQGAVTTILGGGSDGMTAGYTGGDGSQYGVDVLLNAPQGITLFPIPYSVYLLVADTGNSVIRVAYEAPYWTAYSLEGGFDGPVPGFSNGINVSFNMPTYAMSYGFSQSSLIVNIVDSGNNALRSTHGLVTSSPSASSSASMTPSVTASTSSSESLSSSVSASSSVPPTTTQSSSVSPSVTASSSVPPTPSVSPSVSPSVMPTVSVTPSSSTQPAIVAFVAELFSPIGAASVLAPSASLPATLLGLRCDYAALVGVAVPAVRIAGGEQINTNSSAETLAAAIAAANAATTCNARVLRADHPAAQPRRLQASLTTPWAAIAVNIGVISSAGGAAQVAQLVSAASASAADFPLTTAGWAPMWGILPAQWSTTYGSPLALVAGSVVVDNAASFSPLPAPAPGLSNSQQLGLGLGIGITLLVAIAIAVISGCRFYFAYPRAATQLHVVAPKSAHV